MRIELPVGDPGKPRVFLHLARSLTLDSWVDVGKIGCQHSVQNNTSLRVAHNRPCCCVQLPLDAHVFKFHRILLNPLGLFRISRGGDVRLPAERAGAGDRQFVGEAKNGSRLAGIRNGCRYASISSFNSSRTIELGSNRSMNAFSSISSLRPRCGSRKAWNNSAPHSFMSSHVGIGVMNSMSARPDTRSAWRRAQSRPKVDPQS